MILTAPDEPESPREGFCDMHCELDLKVVAWAESNEYRGATFSDLWRRPTAPLRTTWIADVDESTMFLGRAKNSS